jgi:hypothetical protein
MVHVKIGDSTVRIGSMAQKDKVLTVSFGAFSCTLEGFDDPVETLKEVTEYFRALSVSDPGFGEEPKLPDTENLAQIVQRNDARTVDIRANDSGSILLRAEDAEFVPSDRQDDEDDQGWFGTDTPAQSDDATGLTDPLPEDGDEGNGFEDAAVRPTSGSPDVAQPEPTAGSIADKLQRIRAIVSHNEAQAKSDDLAEDDAQTAEFFAGTHIDDLSQALGSDRDSTARETENGHTEREEEIPDAPGPIENSPRAETHPEDDLSTSDLEDEDDFGLPSDDPHPAETAKPNAEPDSSETGVTAWGEDARMQQVPGGLTDPEDVEADFAEPVTNSAGATDDDFSVPYLLRPEQMISDDSYDDDEEDANQDPGAVGLKGEDFEATQERVEMPAEVGETNRGRGSKATLPDRDSDLARLMATAGERMGEPETRNSRETYSQLRAAVAATSAERSSDAAEDDPEIAKAAYQDDLASVVRPTRPSPTRPRRPTEREQHAPLRLVAEQRVDLEDGPLLERHVRPRRVYSARSSGDIDTSNVDTTFAEFAAEQGVTEMPDILEAAVSYLSFVEGRKQFSRPQLMSTLRQIDDGSYDREDSLRSFGNLLREGKIAKAGSGRFVASDEIGFRPDDRATG